MKKDYSYIKLGYEFPVSHIKCLGEEYSKRDASTTSNQKGQLRHYVKCECPFCKSEFEGRLDRLEFNPEKQEGPRTLCCKKCSLTHKRSFKDPWRSSNNNHAAKKGININRTENLEGQLFGELKVGPAKDGYTDKFGLAWWPCKCSCGNFEFVRGNTFTNNKKIACKQCLGVISSGERAVTNWLEQHNIKYSTQDKFENLRGLGDGMLKFDVGIKNDQNKFIYFIEFQGKEHYEPIDFFGGEESFKIRQEHDSRKREWCQKNCIKLIEIPYDYDNLDEYLNQILVN